MDKWSNTDSMARLYCAGVICSTASSAISLELPIHNSTAQMHSFHRNILKA